MLSLSSAGLVPLALSRVAERHHSRAADLCLLLWVHELTSSGQRVLVNDLYRAGLGKRHLLYKSTRRVLAAGWLVRAVRDRSRPQPTLSVTADGLLVIERIRRELRTCREALAGSGRGKLSRVNKRRGNGA